MEHWRFNPETSRPGEGNVWDHARREYLSGQTASMICQRYGMSLRSFRLRARVERWRRIDRDDCDIAPEDGEYHPDDDVGFGDLADQVFLNIRRAVGSGRASEASSWMRLFDKLADRARAEVMADLPDFPLPERQPEPEPEPEPAVGHEPLRLAVTDAVETSSDSSSVEDHPESVSEALHLLHPVFFECKTPPEPEREPEPEPEPETEPEPRSASEPEPPEDIAFSISDSLEETQRKALLLIQRRRLENRIGDADVDQFLKRLGLAP